jgi:tRNA nucleotidyltransferase (CCA-adding enzyme)
VPQADLRHELAADAEGRRVLAIAEAIERAGGRSILVGGAVRDRILGVHSKDLDVEVSGLSLNQLEAVLAEFGSVLSVGRSFGVLMIRGLEVDFSLPRKDSKVGVGHRGFDVSVDPQLAFAEASLRRDLTINSMGFDLCSGQFLDPHGGQRDLDAGLLRATDPQHFSEDPLRGLRVAQFAARFEFSAVPELVQQCRTLDLSELPGERLYEEFQKLLLKGRRPSLGLRFLEESGQLTAFPELAALIGVPQDARWHPEGDVWVHSCMVVDCAAELRRGAGHEDRMLMFGSLCHDFGKPSATEVLEGRIRSHGHDSSGAAPTESFLTRLRAPNELKEGVAALVEHHLAPTSLAQAGASAKSYRKLARKLEQAGVSMPLLERVARADFFGRTTPQAVRREYPAGDEFLRQAAELDVSRTGPKDVVLGRHLIARGFAPGVVFGAVLTRCRDVQDEDGGSEPDAILERVLAERDWFAEGAAGDVS